MKLMKVISILLVISFLVSCTSANKENDKTIEVNDDDVNVEQNNRELEQVENNSSVMDEPDVSLEILTMEGFVMINDYSTDIELKNWGNVKFASGFKMIENLPQLRFYLTDENSLIVYNFPEFEDYKGIYNNMISVSFEDINRDGFKDVIIIGEFMMGHGAEAGKLFPLVNIYFQLEGEFYLNSEVNELINESKSIDSVEKVIEFFEMNNYDWN